MKIVFNKKNGENVFTSFIALLKVKYTSNFSNKSFNEHPHKFNLYGISKLLTEYNVDNVAAKVEKCEIDNIQTPFIAHVGGEFLVVDKVNSDTVSFIRDGDRIIIGKNVFVSSWDGIILLAGTNEKTMEPNYLKNRVKQILRNIQSYYIYLSLLFIECYLYFTSDLCSNPGLSLLLFANIIGLLASVILAKQQQDIHSNYIDKICSLFNHSDCNGILESKASKLFDLISWSEIGIGYFISNIIIIQFFTESLEWLALFSVFTLPYTFWSIWYQKVKAKQWCPFCLIVQMILWIIFIINFYFGYFSIPLFVPMTLITIFLVYTLPILIVNIIVPKFIESSKLTNIVQELNSIKSNEQVFTELLKQQPRYNIKKSASCIIWGNPHADIVVTVLTNPHCNPCSKMHFRILELLNHTNNICVQYIFSSFNNNLNISNKFLIAAYLNSSAEEAERIYSKWFISGKFQKEKFFKKYPYNIESDDVLKEFASHEHWKIETQIRTTPTILVNGFLLPSVYKIEDLRYIDNLDI